MNDAFSTSHRKHASNFGIANFIKESCIGFLIQKELDHLQKLLQPKKPYIVFVGGAKVSDKIALLDKVLPLADYVVIGGAMAFTFLKAQDVNIGKSLLEPAQINIVKNYLSCYAQKIILPQDFIVNTDLNTTTPGKLTADTNIPSDCAGYDVGKKSLVTYQSLVKQAQTIF